MDNKLYYAEGSYVYTSREEAKKHFDYEYDDCPDVYECGMDELYLQGEYLYESFEDYKNNKPVNLSKWLPKYNNGDAECYAVFGESGTPDAFFTNKKAAEDFMWKSGYYRKADIGSCVIVSSMMIADEFVSFDEDLEF